MPSFLQNHHRAEAEDSAEAHPAPEEAPQDVAAEGAEPARASLAARKGPDLPDDPG